MTSSLVGSEMCIRDRRIVYMILSTHIILVRSMWRPKIMQHMLLPSCLLYTSDAADDMSV
eukprot:8735092-Prorocentrum_lima.AAC.1